MNYPLISEYVEAIKAAEDNFEQLKQLRPVLGIDGEPVMSSGNFAVVFKMKDEQTGRLHAVKCFLKEQEGRAEAYRLIAEELEYVSSTFLTPIRYLDKELFVDTSQTDETEFPVLLMDWVEGTTLDKYIRAHLDDKYELSLLAYQFSRLAMWLMPQPFAHGDLKPDNILVRDDGTLALVDYDGMYVPAMKGQRARELGSPDFRHPSRTETDFDEHIDDFSLASILLSLKAISLQPSLLEEYGASDRLLFSEKDYRNLSESKVMDALKSLMQVPELASLYSLFILAASQNNLSQVSFRLFNLTRPEKPQNEEDNLLTEVTMEDLDNAWTDEFGVKYSLDKKRLLEIPCECEKYDILNSTKVICNEAFFNCKNLVSIQIPNSVTAIGKWAFLGCESLTSIQIPDSVTAIGEKAFSYCKKLTSIHIPGSVTAIGKEAFGCEDLETITVSKNNANYNSRNNCNAIIDNKSNTLIAGCKNTVIPDNVKAIGEHAFSLCKSLVSIHIPNSVTTIGKGAFSGCKSLTSFYIPNSVKAIEEWAFLGCESLTSIQIPSSVTAIGDYAFGGCKNLTSIHIPGNVKAIGKGAFSGCVKLIAISVSERNANYNSRNNCNAIIDSKSNTLIAGCKNTFIPENVTAIGDYAFRSCGSLTSIHIPSSMTTIGEGAFSFCERLASIQIPDSVTTIGEKAFSVCKSLTSIHIPNSVTAIGESTFYSCWNLSSIHIPGSVTAIGKGAFCGCGSLTSIHIPDSVRAIGEHAFSLCKSLVSIQIPNSVTTIGEQAFSWCEGLTSIHIPDSVTAIGNCAFYGCSGLTSITISDSVTTIGNSAFHECSNLMRILIPKGTRAKFEKLLPDYIDKFVEEE